jgi:hypothetical protein
MNSVLVTAAGGGLLNPGSGKYFNTDNGGLLGDDVSKQLRDGLDGIGKQISDAISNWGDRINESMNNWFNDQLIRLGDAIKYNGLPIVTVITACLLIYLGLRMFIVEKREKELGWTYWTIMGYTIVRLFWRVVLHV